MKYAIDYRNMNTAIHGLIIYDDEQIAHNSMALYLEMKNTVSQDDYNQMMQELFNSSYAHAEDMNYRYFEREMTVEYFINKGGYVTKENSDVIIINFGQSIDLYI